MAHCRRRHGRRAYDAAFGALGRLYGRDARAAITTLTLFGGLASTVCWPLSAFMASEIGWRGACLVYAAIQFAVALPLYLFVIPRGAEAETRRSHCADAAHSPIAAKPSRTLLVTLAVR